MQINQLSISDIVTLFSVVERKFDCNFIRYDSEEGIEIRGVIDDGLKKIGIESNITKPPVFGNVIFLPWDIDDESVIPLEKITFLASVIRQNIDLSIYADNLSALCKDEQEELEKAVDDFAYKVRWIGNYLTEDKFRAISVARAMSARQELLYCLFGTWSPMNVEILRMKYKLNEQAVKTAERLYSYRQGLAMDVGRKTLFDAFNKFAVRYLFGVGLTVR